MPVDDDERPYEPTFGAEDIDRIRAWHEAAYQEIAHALPLRVRHLGLDIEVPEQVFPPSPNKLLGEMLMREVRPEDRVLDMGTGSGVNALIAARGASRVVAVDVNPVAVDAARRNARRNGLADRITFTESDLFGAVQETFDLIVFDPPFRWFAPRDALEIAMADEGYRTLRSFMAEAPHRLRAGGRLLLFFGTSGDVDYLLCLAELASFDVTVVATNEASRGDAVSRYFVYRMTVR